MKRATLKAFLKDVIGPEAQALYTDELSSYDGMAIAPRHEVVRHSEWYVDGDVHTNNAESFWALLKRGIIGSYHHVSPKHLQRYVDEYCWRANHREVRDPFNAMVGGAVQTGNITYERLTSG